MNILSRAGAHFDHLFEVVQDHPTSVQAIFTGREFVEIASVQEGDIGVVLESTSFYAESGGQVRR